MRKTIDILLSAVALWALASCSTTSNLPDDKIESLYARDPDKYTFWPIFQYNLDANPLLENYSWY